MKNFTVTQKLLSVGATYQVKPDGGNDVAYTIKGKVFTLSPKLEMKKGNDGEVISRMKGNFIGTKFAISDPEGTELGVIQFPFLSFIAKFTLTIGDTVYNAKGGFTARNFSCIDAEGNTKFTIAKELAFRDKFNVAIDESMSEETAILAAVAIDQRFFQKKS